MQVKNMQVFNIAFLQLFSRIIMFLLGIKRVHQEYWVQFLIPHFKGDFQVPEKGERIKYQDDEDQETMSNKKLGIVHMQKRQLLLWMLKYSHIEDGVNFFFLLKECLKQMIECNKHPKTKKSRNRIAFLLTWVRGLWKRPLHSPSTLRVHGWNQKQDIVFWKHSDTH